MMRCYFGAANVWQRSTEPRKKFSSMEGHMKEYVLHQRLEGLALFVPE
jgi:hypothetical protein